MRVGLYGGCFNPVHQGHLLAARGAMDALGLDRVVFIPSGNPPMKGDEGLAPGAHRLAMLQVALSGELCMEASSIEIDRQGPSFTVDTAEMLKQVLPDRAELFFLLGDDCVARLPHWKGIDRLHAMLRFAILPRTPDQPRPADDRLIWLNLPRVDASSTQVRALLAAGERPPPSLMPSAALDYVLRHDLYTAKLERSRV
jgi:nicotinate-nucleotide adenylyltransferase